MISTCLIFPPVFTPCADGRATPLHYTTPMAAPTPCSNPVLVVIEAAPVAVAALIAEQYGLPSTDAGTSLHLTVPAERLPTLLAALHTAGATTHLLNSDPPNLPRARSHQQAIMTSFREDHVRAGMLKPFASLRWKLTGAFLAVSLLLALTVIVIFIAGMAYLLNAPIIPDGIGQSASEMAGFVSEEIGRNGTDPEQLIGTLIRLSGSSSASDPNRSAEERMPPGGDLMITLLDAQGRVLTTTHSLEVMPGLPLDGLEPDPAPVLVNLALSGTTTINELSAWSVGAHQPMAAAPIFAADGTVSGAIYLRLVSFPSFVSMISNLTPFLAGFLLPWVIISGGMGMLYAWLVGGSFARRIVRLTEASADLADGDLSRRIDDASGDELGQLGRQFNAMADQLTASLRSLRLLAERNAQLAEQAAQLAAVEERNRLARELHDSVSQELFSLTMLAAAARRSLDHRPDLAAARLNEIEESARRALEETRSLIFALRPAALDDRGLAPALRELATALAERQGFTVHVSVAGERRLPLEYEQALFRIVQEALANAARHSGVRSAELELRYADEAVALQVRDHGRGFDLTAPRSPQAIGLHSMTERANALGGTLIIESNPGQGTTVAVQIPVTLATPVV
ncbi:MAG: histidine kinase [Oscillochloridaceae bacterium umkhey_bin13]